jgi:hypothetical protein
MLKRLLPKRAQYNSAIHSFQEVLQVELSYAGLEPVKKEKRLPVVLTRAECKPYCHV